MKKTISIIIPVFNRAHLIKETLQSVCNQSYGQWECLVIDDGSTDSTPNTVQEFCAKDSRFKFFSRPANSPKGANACRNLGLANAQGDFLIFLDSDDLLLPDCLQHRAEAIKNNPNFDFYVFQSLLFNHVPNDLDRIPNVLNKPLDDLSRFIAFDYPWNISALVLKKTLFHNSKVSWDERLSCHQDLDFNIKLLTKGFGYKKFPGQYDVLIRMGGDDKVSHKAISEDRLFSKAQFVCNIQHFLSTASIPLPKAIYKRLYNLAVSYCQLFLEHHQSQLIKRVSKGLNVSYFRLRLDTYYWHTTQNNAGFLQKAFVNLYQLGSVKKRLQFLPFNSTLAQLTLKQDLPLSLKVVHIATTPNGGAGIAAYRLHKQLLGLGVQSSFLSLKADTSKSKDVVAYKLPKPTFSKRLRNRMFKSNRFETKIKQLKKVPNVYEGYSFAESPYRLEHHPLVKQADIVHLHWVGGFLDIPTFFKNLNKPIVWTLHDMNPFQGGFHYKHDEDRNKGYIATLEAEILSQKKQAYQQAKALHIVTPTQWLMEASKTSNLLKGLPHALIFNGVDSGLFVLRDKANARKQLGLPVNTTILLFVSETVDNPRKGYDILMDALRVMKHEKDVKLVAVGEPPQSPLPTIRYIGRIEDQLKLSSLYAAADAFVLPSREDNLPNVMLESLLCGTPVLSTPKGGMLEQIKPGFNGYLAKNMTPEALAKVLDTFVETKDTFNPKLIRDEAIRLFDIEQQAKTYLDYYTEIVTAFYNG